MIAKKDDIIAEKDEEIKRLNNLLYTHAGDIARLANTARDAQRRLAGYEEARDIRGTIEAIAKGMSPHKGKSFPGVQATLDKYMLQDDSFKLRLETLCNDNGTDPSTVEKRFKCIYDTLSKEYHGGSDKHLIRNSKFTCIGDRLVVKAILDHHAYPCDIIRDDDIDDLLSLS